MRSGIHTAYQELWVAGHTDVEVAVKHYASPPSQICPHGLCAKSALTCADGGATDGHQANHSSAASEDLFGGLSTAQPAHNSAAAGGGDMFGGLSLGATASSTAAAPAAKQAQPAAAPFDADLFSGAANGHSSHSLPMGIPQQVEPALTCLSVGRCMQQHNLYSISFLLQWHEPAFEDYSAPTLQRKAPEGRACCAEQRYGRRHLRRAPSCPARQPGPYQHDITCQASADEPIWHAWR